MGYNLYITRAKQWPDEMGPKITCEEWLAVVRDDPELAINAANGLYFAEWTSLEGDESWFDLDNGAITTKNPDEPEIRKMLLLAQRLHAHVVGDDGEVYDEATLAEHPPTENVVWAMVKWATLMAIGPFALSTCLLIVLWLLGLI